MGCGSCGTSANGKPSGCNSNGGCSSGGCNRLNVFDWLSTIPLQDNTRIYSVIEVSFNKGSRKDYFRNQSTHYFKKGDLISVEGLGGYDIGTVNLTGELVKLQLKKNGIADSAVTKRALHPATEEEKELHQKQKDREKDVLIRARSISKSLNLEMKLCEVEIQSDGKKGTFFYTADNRVDFRELIKVFASDFKMKIEMRQIGARQESGKVGGIGSCGRELCCSTWLNDFKSVNTTSARYQNLAINQVKLSGQCGRLKCCLNYELDTYMDALSVFPDNADTLETVKGPVTLQKRDIFKNLMWYSYSDNNKQYPLTITRVKEIAQLNRKGQKAEELQPVELDNKETNGEPKRDTMGFVNDVGQVTLKSLDKKSKKRNDNNRQQNNQGGQQKGQQGGGQKNQQQKQNNQPQGQRGPQQSRPENQQPRPQQAQLAKEQGEPKPGQQQNQRRADQPREPKQGQQPNKPQQQGQNNQKKQQQGPRPQQQGQKNQNPNRPQQKRGPQNAENTESNTPPVEPSV